MARININNGNGTYYGADEAGKAIKQLAENLRISEKDAWDEIVSWMDNDTREVVHIALAPCSEEEFLAEYLRRAPYDIIIG